MLKPEKLFVEINIILIIIRIIIATIIRIIAIKK